MSKIEQLRITGQLPSPKGVALALMRITQREDATLDEIIQVVRTDPALTSRLLRLANSAANGGRGQASVNEAVMHLGMASVRQLAMGFSLVDQYSRGPCSRFDYQGFWSHSLLFALAARALGEVLGLAGPEELFVCGLLGRIGELALATAYPLEYAGILERGTRQETLPGLEREHLGTDSKTLSAEILADCGIPNALAEPLHFHEAPESSGFAQGSRPHQLTHLFSLARHMADLGMASEDVRLGNISELMLLAGRFGLDADALGELFDRLARQWREWGALLDVLAPELPDFDSMAKAPAPRPEQVTTVSSMRVLLVEDEPTSRIVTAAALRQLLGCEVHTAENGGEALAVALKVMPQIVITDWLMPVMDGLALCRALRATDWGQSMYLVMLTGVETEEKIVEAFEAGVDDYVSKPVNPRALNARMRAALHYVKLLDAWESDRSRLKQFAAELAISNRRLEHAAMTDLLTGLPNRRAGMEALATAWSASVRGARPLSALMIDIDHFKSINDRYGHAVGDVVLREVAMAIQIAARKQDSVSRVGGEEFLLVCQNADTLTASQAAERLRKRVKSLKITIANIDIMVTVSIGVADREPGMNDPDDMVRHADQALYRAKRGGRDRICVFSHDRVNMPVSSASDLFGAPAPMADSGSETALQWQRQSEGAALSDPAFHLDAAVVPAGDAVGE